MHESKKRCMNWFASDIFVKVRFCVFHAIDSCQWYNISTIASESIGTSCFFSGSGTVPGSIPRSRTVSEQSKCLEGVWQRALQPLWRTLAAAAITGGRGVLLSALLRRIKQP